MTTRITRSGRKTINTEVKIKKGCVHYQKEKEKYVSQPNEYDYTDGFLVKDNEPILYMSEESDTESEFLSSDEETETESVFLSSDEETEQEPLEFQTNTQSDIESDDPEDEDYITESEYSTD